jgi:hypothetical protein
MNSYLAIFLAGLIPMILGFVWYHPKVFGAAVRQCNMAVSMGVATIIAMFLSYRMNDYSSHTQPGMSQFVHGFFHGGVSMGLPAALILISNGLFQRNTWTNLIINALYWFVTLGLMGAFLYSVATPEVATGG